MEKISTTNDCPVCGGEVKYNSEMHYCEACGFNIINDKIEDTNKAVSDDENNKNTI